MALRGPNSTRRTRRPSMLNTSIGVSSTVPVSRRVAASPVSVKSCDVDPIVLVCCHATFAPYLTEWRSTDANQFPRQPYGDRYEIPSPFGIDEVSWVNALA